MIVTEDKEYLPGFILQAYTLRLISRRTAIEKLGIVKDVDEELRRIFLEDLRWA